jgi:hypothetical protein
MGTAYNAYHAALIAACRIKVPARFRADKAL